MISHFRLTRQIRQSHWEAVTKWKTKTKNWCINRDSTRCPVIWRFKGKDGWAIGTCPVVFLDSGKDHIPKWASERQETEKLPWDWDNICGKTDKWQTPACEEERLQVWVKVARRSPPWDHRSCGMYRTECKNTMHLKNTFLSLSLPAPFLRSFLIYKWALLVQRRCQRLVLRSLPQSHSTLLFFRQGLSLNLDLAGSVRLTEQWATEVCTTVPGLFYVDIEDQNLGPHVSGANT